MLALTRVVQAAICKLDSAKVTWAMAKGPVASYFAAPTQLGSSCLACHY